MPCCNAYRIVTNNIGLYIWRNSNSCKVCHTSWTKFCINCIMGAQFVLHFLSTTCVTLLQIMAAWCFVSRNFSCCSTAHGKLLPFPVRAWSTALYVSYRGKKSFRFKCKSNVRYGTRWTYLVYVAQVMLTNLQKYYFHVFSDGVLVHINPLKTKRRPLYLKIQSVPHCKHFSSRLWKPISLCCKWHKSLFLLR